MSDRVRTVCEQCLLKVNPLKGNENEVKQGRWETEQIQGVDKDVADCSKGYPMDFPGQTMSMPSKHGKTINCCAACSVLRLLCIWNDYFFKIIQQIVREPASGESISGGSREMRRNTKTEISDENCKKYCENRIRKTSATVIYPSISACRR